MLGISDGHGCYRYGSRIYCSDKEFLLSLLSAGPSSQILSASSPFSARTRRHPPLPGLLGGTFSSGMGGRILVLSGQTVIGVQWSPYNRRI
jgi:hypothetical protein